MREFRPVAPADAASADLLASAAGIADSGRSAIQVLASAAYIAAPRVAPASRPAPATSPAPVGRIDLSRLTAVPPLHRPSVTGAGAGHAGNHVGGAMLPLPPNTVDLSDGTSISFGAVEEVPVQEYA
jgi:hypothetical protein